MHRKICMVALVVGHGGKNSPILIIRYHNSRRPLSHSRYIAEVSAGGSNKKDRAIADPVF